MIHLGKTQVFEGHVAQTVKRGIYLDGTCANAFQKLLKLIGVQWTSLARKTL